MEHHYETITATLDTNVQFDFEALLRKYFGLKGEYHSKEYKQARALTDDEERSEAYEAILEKSGPGGYFTAEAWEAWDKALAFIEDLARAGVINDDIYYHISNQFCDNSCK